MEETATRGQIRLIKKLGLDDLVPLNVHPMEVNDRVLDLETRGKIDGAVFANYWGTRARRYVSSKYSGWERCSDGVYRKD